VAELRRSGVCDVPLLWPFQASTDTLKDTTEELCSIAAQYAINPKYQQGSVA
jgi:hypothetical protein